MSNFQPPPAKITKVLTEAGTFSPWWYNWFNLVKLTFDGSVGLGFSGTITTAKLTGGGANGSMTFVNGVLTARTAAT